MIEKYVELILEQYFAGAKALDAIEKVKGEMRNVKSSIGNGKYISSGSYRNNCD